MTTKKILKKLLAATIMTILAVPFLLWIHFVLSPFIEAKKMGAELISSPIFWPINDENMNIPFINGRALIFRQTGGRKNTIRVVDSGDHIYDVDLPDGKQFLYKTFQNIHSNPLIAIWDNHSDLQDMGVYSQNSALEIKCVEITKNYKTKIDIFQSNKLINVLSIADGLLIGETFGKNSKGKSIYIPLLISLPGKKFNYLLPKLDKSLENAFFFTEKIIYSTSGSKGLSTIHSLSLHNGNINTISKTSHVQLFPFGWSGYGDIIVWVSRQVEFSNPKNGHEAFYLWSYDFSKNIKSVIANGKGAGVSPHLHKEYLFWSDNRNAEETGYDVYVKNLNKGKIKLVVKGDHDESFPVYFNNYLYWTVNIPSFFGSQRYVLRKNIILP